MFITALLLAAIDAAGVRVSLGVTRNTAAVDGASTVLHGQFLPLLPLWLCGDIISAFGTEIRKQKLRKSKPKR